MTWYHSIILCNWNDTNRLSHLVPVNARDGHAGRCVVHGLIAALRYKAHIPCDKEHITIQITATNHVRGWPAGTVQVSSNADLQRRNARQSQPVCIKSLNATTDSRLCMMCHASIRVVDTFCIVQCAFRAMLAWCCMQDITESGVELTVQTACAHTWHPGHVCYTIIMPYYKLVYITYRLCAVCYCPTLTPP